MVRGRRRCAAGTVFGFFAAASAASLLPCVLGLSACAETPATRDLPLRIALHGAPTAWDPHLQSEVMAQIVLGHVYESLITFDTRMRPVPQLAERWESPDETSWRFTLREGVTFHDGRPLRVEDVLASFERARRHPKSRQAGALVAVESWRKVDERTFELRTENLYPILLNKLAPLSIVPADAPDEITAPIGTGPYRFQGKTGEQVALEAVPDHWQRRAGGAYPSAVTIFFEADPQARLQGLLEERWDLIDEVPVDQVASLSQDARVRIESMSSLSVTYLQFDADLAPFDDRRVRQALDLLIDRQAVVENELAGFGQTVGQMVSPNVFGFNPELLPTRRDPAKARALLAEAGFPEGLELEIEYREGRELGVLERQLAEGGLRVRGVARPWTEMYPRLQSGVVPIYLGSWICTSGDASDLLDRKLHTPDPRRGWGDANWSGYSNPALDALIEESQLLLNSLERGNLLKKAMAISSEDLYFLPIYSPSSIYAVRQGLVWSPRRDGRIFANEMSWKN